MALSLILAHTEPPTEQLTALLNGQFTPIAIVTGVAIAYIFGAVHALSPGHGKTLVGAYLVGSRGTPQDALWLGLTTTVTHTLTIFLLGTATLLASHYINLDQIYPILGAISGVAICLVGVRLLTNRLKESEHQHHHHHDQEHGHGHGHHHHHDHQKDDWSSILTIGISGGLVPCPSALVLMLSAISLHKIAYGLVLISSFSVGLASVLISLGLAAVYGRQWLETSLLGPGTIKRLSVVSAMATICIGIGLTTVALR